MRIRIKIDIKPTHQDESTLHRLVHILRASTESLAQAMSASGSSVNMTSRSQSESFMANPVLQQLADAVSRNKQVVDSAVILIQGIGDRINDAVQKALVNGATEAELAPLTDLVTTLGNESDALANAVAANTPAAPPTAPQPETTAAKLKP